MVKATVLFLSSLSTLVIAATLINATTTPSGVKATAKNAGSQVTTTTEVDAASFFGGSNGDDGGSGVGSGAGADELRAEMDLYCQFIAQVIDRLIDTFSSNDTDDTVMTDASAGGEIADETLATTGDEDISRNKSKIKLKSSKGAGKKGNKKQKAYGNATKAQVTANKCAKGKLQYSEQSINWIILLTIASAFVVFLTFTQQRRTLCPGLAGGRPAFLKPFPVIDSCRHRLTYVAFWAMVPYDGIQILIIGKANLFIPTTCVSKWEAPIVVLINIHIFAILYFPVIGAMSTDTPLGYMIATTWIWALTVVRGFDIVQELKDSVVSSSSDGDTSQIWFSTFFSVIPVISMLYLCVVLPLRLTKGLYLYFVAKRASAYLPMCPPPPYASTPEGLYVRELFSPPKPAPKRTGIKKVFNILEKFYKNRPYFRYSQNILSAMIIGLIFVYFIALLDILALVQMSSIVPTILQTVDGLVLDFFSNPLAAKILLKATKSNDTAALEKKLTSIIDTAEAHIYCLIYSNVAALIIVFFLQVYLNVTMLQAYRDDRLRAHKGIYVVLSPPLTKARGIIGGAVRYMGFQAVMYAWGIIIQLILFTFIGIVFGYAIIIPLVFGYGDPILKFIITLLPALAVTIGLSIVLQLVVAFCFTAVPCGNALAVNNPRGYSNYAYISFFKSLFIGLVNALLRLIFSVVVGAIIFSRLDMPTVTPKFKMLDFGFKQYESLIHLENAHMHPVLVTFVNIVCDRIKRQAAERKELRARVELEIEQQPKRPRRSRFHPSDGSMAIIQVSNSIERKLDIEAEFDRAVEAERKRRCIRFKWLLLRTLTCNPKIGIERKMALQIDQFKKREPANVKIIS